MDNFGTTKTDDEQLVYDLIESMYAGIALMKQGQIKAETEQVRALAKKLETKHIALTKELEELSRKKGWELPAGVPEKDEDKLESMEEREGESYDRKWLRLLRKRHKTNISKIEDAEPADLDVQEAGAKGLPKLKELLQEIESVQDSL